MTIERGSDWGGPGALPSTGVTARSDAEARRVAEADRRAGRPVRAIGLLGGDLCRTVGGPGDEQRLFTPDAVTLPCDLGAVLLDGHLHWFVAHLVARRSWLRGQVTLVMNAEWLGRWDVAPRAHPGDAKLDLLEADLSAADRWKAWRRLPSGQHVPHRGITIRQVAAWQAEFARPINVWLDGEPMGAVHSLSVRVEPDALTVVV